MLKKIVGLEIIWEYLHSTHSDFDFHVKEYVIPGERINAWVLRPQPRTIAGFFPR